MAFRTDASIQIGTGHVMRCLTLADELRDRSAQCIFICRQHPGHLLDLIVQHGYEVRALPVGDDSRLATADNAHCAWLGTNWGTDSMQTRQALGNQRLDWLVIDHYALDIRWEQATRSACERVLVIDDLADRSHDCDLLLDQNLGRTEQDYDGLLTSDTKMLIGPQYALLRREFAHWRDYSLARRAQPHMKNLLITLGGVDKGNITGQVLRALKSCELPTDLSITVIMGLHAPWLSQVQAQVAEMPWPTQVLVGVSNMAQLMADSDLAIGAAGGTIWEMCMLGLPTIILVTADNQKLGAMAVQRASAAAVVVDVIEIRSLLRGLCNHDDNGSLSAMAQSAARLIDGAGVSRIANMVYGIYV